METDPVSALRQSKLFVNAILKAAAMVLFPQGAKIPNGCINFGGNLAQDRVRICEELKKIGYLPEADVKDTFKDLSNAERINLVVTTANNVAGGVERFLNGQTDVNEYPAWELVKMYGREEPETNWPDHWYAAVRATGDACALNVFETTRRMVALKSSAVWQALGDGCGGYESALGNPWPPFVVGSGFDVAGVDYKECVNELLLLKIGEQTKPAIILSPDEFAGRFAIKLNQFLLALEQNRDFHADDEESD